MLESQKHIYEFLNSTNYELLADNIKFEYDKQIVTYLSKQKIKFETIRDEEIIITYQDLKFDIFEEASDYLKFSVVKKNNDTLIKEVNEFPISLINNKNYINFIIQNENHFYDNAKNFVEFIDFLKSKDSESEDAFHFIDYVNDVNRKIVLTSLTEKSRLILKYYNEIPNFSTNIDYSNGLNQFKLCFVQENNNLPKFLKSSLIKFTSRYEEKLRIKELFINLIHVVEDAKMNFEIYINNLSIDKIRKDYDEYKSRYFNEVSDILKKITQKIISFPIVIASTLFAIEKVKENFYFLSILAIAILITSIYLILLLHMNYKDLNYVKHLSEKDFDLIKENNFFKKFPNQFETFKKIKERISSRINNLHIIVESYFWVLSLSNLAIITLIFHYLNINNKGIFLMVLVVLFFLIILRNNISKEKDENDVKTNV